MLFLFISWISSFFCQAILGHQLNQFVLVSGYFWASGKFVLFYVLTIFAHQLGWIFLTSFFVDILVYRFFMFGSRWPSNMLIVYSLHLQILVAKVQKMKMAKMMITKNIKYLENILHLENILNIASASL